MNADLPLGSGHTLEQQRQSLKAKFGKILPAVVNDELLAAGAFPGLLAQMFRLAAESVLHPAGEKIFFPLLLTSYRDSNQMFTLTGLVGPQADAEAISPGSVAFVSFVAAGMAPAYRVRRKNCALGRKRIPIVQNRGLHSSLS